MSAMKLAVLTRANQFDIDPDEPVYVIGVVSQLIRLPIWTLRRFMKGQRLWHDPRVRQCALASLTTFVFTGTELTGLRYSEPAGSSDPTATGA